MQITRAWLHAGRSLKKPLFSGILLTAAVLLASGGPVRAADTAFQPFFESFPNGRIDWDNGFFYGTGRGYPHRNNGSRARALKVAQATALSAILQVASRVRIDDRNLLTDLEKKKGILQIKGLVTYEPFERQYRKKAPQPYYEVTYRAPLRGVKGLTSRLLPYLRPGPAPRLEPDPGDPVEEFAPDGPWLVLDARGVTAGSGPRPAVFPKIVTQDGETVHDLTTADEDALVARGMARYVVSDTSRGEMARRGIFGHVPDLRTLLAGSVAHAEERRPRKKRGRYVIKDVQEARGLTRANLVISRSDARDIRQEDASSKILKQCRVIVIISGSLGGIEGMLPGRLALRR